MIFKANKPTKRAQQMLDEANVARLEHRAAAEFNTAMADMLDARIERLQKELAPEVVEVSHG